MKSLIVHAQPNNDKIFWSTDSIYISKQKKGHIHIPGLKCDLTFNVQTLDLSIDEINSLVALELEKRAKEAEAKRLKREKLVDKKRVEEQERRKRRARYESTSDIVKSLYSIAHPEFNEDTFNLEQLEKQAHHFHDQMLEKEGNNVERFMKCVNKFYLLLTPQYIRKRTSSSYRMELQSIRQDVIPDYRVLKKIKCWYILIDGQQKKLDNNYLFNEDGKVLVSSKKFKGKFNKEFFENYLKKLIDKMEFSTERKLYLQEIECL